MEEHEKNDNKEKFNRVQQTSSSGANDLMSSADAGKRDEKSSTVNERLTATMMQVESSTKRSLYEVDRPHLKNRSQSIEEQKSSSTDIAGVTNATNGNPEISSKRLKTGISDDNNFPKTPATTPISDDVENGESKYNNAIQLPPTPPPSAASTATNASSVAHSETAFASVGSASAAKSPHLEAPRPSGGSGWTDDDAYESMPKTPVAPPQMSSSRAAIRQNAMSPLPGIGSFYLPDVPPAPPTTPAPKLSSSGYRDLGLATPLPFSAGFVQNANQLELQQRQYQQRQKELQHEVQEGAVTPAPNRDQPKTEATASTKPKSSSISDDFSEWAVGDRYQLCRMLGRGSYGEVAQAIDKYQGKNVAIKRIVGPFDQEVDAVRLFREIHILRRLRTLGENDCIVPLLDVVQPPTDDLNDFHDLYLVFDYVDTDLYKLIMSPQYLTTEHIQTFLYQMLIGLKYIHSGNVIHRDLKPANILLNEDCSLKICDFGLARIVDEISVARSSSAPSSSAGQSINANGPNPAAGIGTRMRAAKMSAGRSCSISEQSFSYDDNEGGSTPSKMPLTRQLTKHVVTRWYRAPELILIQPYTTAVDVWSLGCIFAELLSMQEGSVPGYQDRTPLFPGGACYPLSGDTDNAERLDQLNVIFNVIGTPSAEDIATLGKANEYIKTLKPIKPRNLKDIYPAADPNALDLLNKMLKFNPNERCTAEEALNHNFLAGIRREEMETSVGKPMESPAFLNEQEIDINTLKKKAYDEVLWFRDNQNFTKLPQQTMQTPTSTQTTDQADLG